MASESVATEIEVNGIRDLLISTDEARTNCVAASNAVVNVGNTLTSGVRAIGDLMWVAAQAAETAGPIEPDVIADLGYLLRTVGELQQRVTEIGYTADYARNGG